MRSEMTTAKQRGVRTWTCEACGKRETWRKGWGYYENVPSEVPGEAGFPAATCSDACEDALFLRWRDRDRTVAP